MRGLVVTGLPVFGAWGCRRGGERPAKVTERCPAAGSPLTWGPTPCLTTHPPTHPSIHTPAPAPAAPALAQIRAKEEARKRDEEARKERERQDKYAAAVETEEMRKSSIRARALEKERMLAELYAQRKKEHDLRKVDLEFQLKLRLDKVDR